MPIIPSMPSPKLQGLHGIVSISAFLQTSASSSGGNLDRDRTMGFITRTTPRSRGQLVLIYSWLRMDTHEDVSCYRFTQIKNSGLEPGLKEMDYLDIDSLARRQSSL
jgi:hypothetical protein